jgi:hypothetical protein
MVAVLFDRLIVKKVITVAAANAILDAAIALINGIPNKFGSNIEDPSCNINYPGQKIEFGGRTKAVKLEMRTPQATAAIEEEIHDLVQAEPRETETDIEIAPLIQRVAASSIAEIERLLGELQAAKDFLQSEGERIQRETAHYTNLTQTASASIKIIFDTVHQWRKAGHPVHDQSRSSALETTSAQANADMGETSVPDEQSPLSSGQVQPWYSKRAKVV